MTRPGSDAGSRHRAQQRHPWRRARSGRSPRRRAAAGDARPAEEGDAEARTKQAAASAAASASIAPTAGTISLRPHCGSSGLSRMAWNISHSETKPLSGGSAEIARQPPRNRKAVSGMRWIRPPSCSMSRSPVAFKHGAGAEEQQALEQRVIEDVEQRRGERERRRGRHAVGLEGEREAEADEDDADVLDRAVGEQPLEVALHEGAEHAEHGGDAAEREHDDAPPPGRRAEQIEDDADEAVDRDLGHHAAHQRRDVARRGRMGERQPDVQRHEAGLRAGAEQHQHQDEAGQPCGVVDAAHLGETRSRRRGPRAGRRPAAAPACRSSPSRCRCSPRAGSRRPGGAPSPAPRTTAT